MKIYTKTGDKGKTSLFNGNRVLKDNARVDTYGTIDELNSILGVLVSTVKDAKVKEEVTAIQHDLLDLGAHLANPTSQLSKSLRSYFEERIRTFEENIDAYTRQLPQLVRFVLPGGSYHGSLFHVARTVARRVERKVVGLSQKESVDSLIITYFNRLSDLLFTLSRWINQQEKAKEIIWKAR